MKNEGLEGEMARAKKTRDPRRIRIRQTVRQWAAEAGKSTSKAARDALLHPSTINRPLKDESLTQDFSPDTLQKYGEACGRSEGEIKALNMLNEAVASGRPLQTEALQAEDTDHGGRGALDLPVYRTAQGGIGMNVIVTTPIEYRLRSESVAEVENAFAVYVVGDSMEPRIDHGELVIVNPARPARPGDDVMFVHADSGAGEWVALIKRLVAISESHWTVRQYNPPRDFELARAEWPTAYRIQPRAPD